VPESSRTSCFEEVLQVVVPVGCQTSTVSVQVHQNVASGAKSAICDRLFADAVVTSFLTVYQEKSGTQKENDVEKLRQITNDG